MSTREILFRGKRTNNGEWVEGLPSYDADGLITEIEAPESLEAGYFIDVDPETVCQYTGLPDRNGRKIFEGDIIRYEKKKYSVVWFNSVACFASKPLEYGRSSPCMNEGTMKISEVIGNIFDNPELIEQGDDAE